MLQAINPRNQELVNKALKYNERYDYLNDQRGLAENCGFDKLVNKLNRMCEDAFDKHLDAYNQLPKNQQLAITKYLTPRW